MQTALSLVSYDKEVTNAMKYVFGNTFVCQDSASAKAVTFNSEIRTRSVTLEGDVFDPAGTLTGGSRAQNNSVLGQLQTLNDAKGIFFTPQNFILNLSEKKIYPPSLEKFFQSNKNFFFIRICS